MNAVPAITHEAERFDIAVMRAFAADPSRHTRDQLIAAVDAGRHGTRLLRSAGGFSGLSAAEERRAALTSIDFAFEQIVMPTLSLAQAKAYCEAVERSLQFGDVSGLDGRGPLWVDTVHHSCVFSVLFQFATHLREMRHADRGVLLHQGDRPEPRLGTVAKLAAQLLKVPFVTVPMRGSWFRDLAAGATPHTVILSMADMPAVAFPAASQRRQALLELHTASGLRRQVDVVSGSALLARRLGASHLVLDYPQPDLIRIAPYAPGRPAACPLVDWVFWPVLVGTGPTPARPVPQSKRAS